MDYTLIKNYLYSDPPSDREKVPSYYMQLKNILTILEQPEATIKNNTQIPQQDSYSIRDTIESKMKYLELHFGDLLIQPVTPNTSTVQTQQVVDNYSDNYSYANVAVPPTATTTIVHNQPFTLVNSNPPIAAGPTVTTATTPTTVPLLSVLGDHKKRSHHHHKSSGPPEIPPEEIIFDPKVDHLGGGAYGKVYRATCRGKKVAVKVPKKQTLSESELKAFKNEVEIWKQIYHPNVVMCMGACTKPGKIMIVSELMQSDLEKIIHPCDGTEPPPLFQRMKMAHDAAVGMNWLHGICNILHRDLKLANLMIGKDNTVKITDFGFSQVLKSGTTTTDQRGPKGTALYMAPEVMMKQEFNEKADVYSFGLILYELATCEELFPEYSELEPFSDAICNKRLRPTIPNHFPKSLANLMKRCWDHDASQRPSFHEIFYKMNEVLIDIAISDPNASAFWKNSFSSPEDVKWSVLALKLSEAVGIDISELKLLSRLFVSTNNDDENDGMVNIERFDLMTKWYGPFYKSGAGPILREMSEMLKKKWFHFDISRDVSERRLRGRPENTFLIRLSLNDPIRTPLTISKIKSGKPTHKRVVREDVPVSADFPLGCKFLVPIDGVDIVFNNIISIVDRLKQIGNLGPECPHAEIKIPYVND